MIKLSDAQQKIYDSISTNEFKYEFSTLEEIKKSYPTIFKDLTKEDFELNLKNNSLEVVKKVFNKELSGLSDEDVLKYWPRGCFPIVGKDEYLKYSRILGNSEIYNNPKVLDDSVELLDSLVKSKLKTVFSTLEEIDPNLLSSVLNVVTDLKNQLLSKVKDFLGIKDKIFTNPVDARNEVFNQNITDKKTTSEEMPKVPHQIRAFGEPRNTANPQYPHNHIFVSPGGHITEYDDSPESPRVRIQHSNGSKMEVDGDGNHILKSTADKYDIVDENHYKYIKGHATEVTDKKVMKSYKDGVLYQTTNVQTYASERAHFQTPIISYNEMLLGKNAIFSNNVVVKNNATTKTCNVEEKLTAKNALIKTMKGDWANVLAREATVAWDIGSSGSEGLDDDNPPGGGGFGENRPMVNKSLQFKDGAQGNPSFIKPVTMDHPVSFATSNNINETPITGQPNAITVHDGVLYVSDSNGRFIAYNKQTNPSGN